MFSYRLPTDFSCFDYLFASGRFFGKLQEVNEIAMLGESSEPRLVVWPSGCTSSSNSPRISERSLS
jgi:hypothetical protein